MIAVAVVVVDCRCVLKNLRVACLINPSNEGRVSEGCKCSLPLSDTHPLHYNLPFGAGFVVWVVVVVPPPI